MKKNIRLLTSQNLNLSWKCRRHVATCRRRHNVSLQFWPDGSVSPTQNLRCRGSLCRLVSARADILPNFRNSYVEIYYYRMGVHTQRYYPSQRSFLSCSPFCHVLHRNKKLPQHSSTQLQTQPRTMSDSTIRPCLLQRLWVQ